jgi:hypothetical protein
VQPIDRDRLRATLTAAAAALSLMADQAITAKLPQMVPPSLRPLIPLLAGRLQTRSILSDAATRATNELSDDELWALWRLIQSEAAQIFPAQTWAEAAVSELPVVRDAAIAHLRAILSE